MTTGSSSSSSMGSLAWNQASAQQLDIRGMSALLTMQLTTIIISRLQG
jgi:hypothetical protein